MDPNKLVQWTNLITAAQPLIAAGAVVVKDLVGMFHNANPTATDEELNIAFGQLSDQAAAERVEIAKERAAAQAEIDAEK